VNRSYVSYIENINRLLFGDANALSESKAHSIVAVDCVTGSPVVIPVAVSINAIRKLCASVSPVFCLIITIYLMFAPTDVVTMTVRLTAGTTQTIIKKDFTPDGDGHILIVIAPSDTADLEPVTGVYDIQWVEDADNVFTLIPTSGNTARLPTFQICPDVSYEVPV
jgi:phospholipid N-methyltransferase